MRLYFKEVWVTGCVEKLCIPELTASVKLGQLLNHRDSRVETDNDFFDGCFGDWNYCDITVASKLVRVRR